MDLTVIEERSQPVPESGCWLWDKATMYKGYGILNYKGKTTRAHRLSYILAYGDIPNNLHVLHRCDTPSCVNPAHLFLGTNATNVRDKMNKGRGLFGENNPAAKLTKDDVALIRSDVRTSVQLAKVLGVSKGAVTSIRAGKTWAI